VVNLTKAVLGQCGKVFGRNVFHVFGDDLPNMAACLVRLTRIIFGRLRLGLSELPQPFLKGKAIGGGLRVKNRRFCVGSSS
jgi:hypothetical protein